MTGPWLASWLFEGWTRELSEAKSEVPCFSGVAGCGERRKMDWVLATMESPASWTPKEGLVGGITVWVAYDKTVTRGVAMECLRTAEGDTGVQPLA
jgi:hypothetical protein